MKKAKAVRVITRLKDAQQYYVKPNPGLPWQIMQFRASEGAFYRFGCPRVVADSVFRSGTVVPIPPTPPGW